jgi:tetratricopeptide (TPR) repeat protein
LTSFQLDHLIHIHLSQLTYISHAAHETWKDGKLDETEEILSNEITDQGFRGFVHYARANRSLVRARQRKWDEALEDAEAAMSYNGQKPLIAYIAKGMALCGQKKHEGAVNVFDAVLRDCDNDTKNFVERIKSIIFFEVELRDTLHRGTELSDLFQGVDVCTLVNAQVLVLLAELHMRNGDYDKALQLLLRAPDLGSFLYVPEAKAIFLVRSR